MRIGVLAQVDGRWGTVRLLAPGQVKLNWVHRSPSELAGEFVEPVRLGAVRISRKDLLDERGGLMDLIAHASLREGNAATFAQWVEGTSSTPCKQIFTAA